MSARDRLVLWIAEGFGAGRLHPGPGTWGSVVGLAWLIALLCTASLVIWVVGTLAVVALAIPLCERAEILLQRHDPGSVVLDEIAAVPLIGLGVWFTPARQAFPHPMDPITLTSALWPELLGGFLAFRLFDIAKPGPIRSVQKLRGGFGVVADDLLAALGAAVVTATIAFIRWQMLK